MSSRSTEADTSLPPHVRPATEAQADAASGKAAAERENTPRPRPVSIYRNAAGLMNVGGVPSYKP